MSTNSNYTNDEALRFHAEGRPGKLEVAPTKPMATQRDLSLAYSPGVAAPCLEIEKNPALAYDYTAKGNMVAVISNGTAVLGLGNIGALAAKPVMEGKSVLFKRFADVDSIDLELSTEDVDEFINAVRFLGPSFGGINLEDIKAPDCFVIEERLREMMDIPIFHDDQHGTAIISAAGLINALHLTDRDIATTRLVVNGAGSAGIACAALLKSLGMPHDNVIMCDTRGVIYKGRTDGMNQWKSAHAAETDARTLADAMHGSDVVFGLSVKGALTAEMIASMADKPIIFAMANPDPEITPEEVREIRDDAIVATGRSDYPNQVNNVLGFPYIFRGALDVRATTINEEMKVAAAQALAELAREDVPDEVAAAYAVERLRYGPEYIIPVPFDPRLISHVPAAVARAAIESGVAQRQITDFGPYEVELRARLDPTIGTLQLLFDQVRENPKRVVFAEGEEEQVIRAAMGYLEAGYGKPVLIGREHRVRETMERIGMSGFDGLEVHNARLSHNNERFTDFLYARLQRSGALYRDCQRIVNQDRNIFAACMVALGEADAMVTGATRNYNVAHEEVRRVLDAEDGRRVFGISVIVSRERTVLAADTTVHELPAADVMVDIAMQTAEVSRWLGQEPRVALLSHSNFGQPPWQTGDRIREAVRLLGERGPDFEFEGEMAADIALNPDLAKLYPFSRLSGPANVLIMPALHSASIASKLMQELGGGTVVGPILVGLEKPVQIAGMGATVNDLINLAAFAARQAGR